MTCDNRRASADEEQEAGPFQQLLGDWSQEGRTSLSGKRRFCF